MNSNGDDDNISSGIVGSHIRRNDDPTVKVFLSLPVSESHEFKSESLWATPKGPEFFQIRNVPFYAKGISFDDVVSCSYHGKELWFEKVISRGGHSTYRFILMDGIGDEQWKPYWQSLEDLGCTYERATGRLFAVDVPSKIDIYRAYAHLNAGEKGGVWGFEEGHCGHALQS